MEPSAYAPAKWGFGRQARFHSSFFLRIILGLSGRHPDTGMNYWNSSTSKACTPIAECSGVYRGSECACTERSERDVVFFLSGQTGIKRAALSVVALLV